MTRGRSSNPSQILTATDPRAAIPGGSGHVDTAPCCVPSGSAPMDAALAVSLSRQFKAIADPDRLRLVSLVSESGKRGVRLRPH
jgi:ArsR family transcriptional regulator